MTAVTLTVPVRPADYLGVMPQSTVLWTRLPRERLAVAVYAAVAVGIGLRFLWPSDMEYKGDEQYVYAHAIAPAPLLLGDRASVGIPNPGMGQWLFWLMAHLMRLFSSSTPSPVGLDRGVILLNALALVGLLVFALKVVGAHERQPWLYAIALLALNPMSILFSRKLWIQCLLAPFALGALWGWWRRGTRGGAFAWGLVGLWLGQIHMTGLFFTAGFVLWTALFDRRSVRWRWWLVGSTLGALTLVPWLVHVLSSHAAPVHDLGHVLRSDFWYFWLSTPVGHPLLVSFGSDAGRLLALPTVFGMPLHLVGIALGASVVCAVVILVKALASQIEARLSAGLAAARRPPSDSARAVSAGLVAYGVLLSASGVTIFRHYVIVASVLPFLFLAQAAMRAGRLGKPLLTAIIVAQAVVSIGYLSYIHTHGGAPSGDYGYAYDSPRALASR
jgi:hypothetical protein